MEQVFRFFFSLFVFFGFGPVPYGLYGFLELLFGMRASDKAPVKSAKKVLLGIPRKNS